MKKFFLIPLMTLMCSVMAWGTTWPVSTWQDLYDAIYSASLQDGDVISFQNDITFPADKQGKTISEASGYGTLCIRKSITIEGNDKTLTGSGKRSNGTYVTLGINQNGTQAVAVTIQNLSIINDKNGRALECRGTTAKPITALTLTNCHLSGQETFVIGNSHTNKPHITITNSTIEGGGSYPILTFNPFIMDIDNSTISGYCGIYFKGQVGSAGSRGAVVTATNSNFNCPNSYAGSWNSFGVFALEDDGITITLNNCGVDARALSSARSTLITLSTWTDLDRRSNDVTLNITGDNSYVMGQMVNASWHSAFYNSDLTKQALQAASDEYTRQVDEDGHVWGKDAAGHFSIDLGEEPSKAFSSNTANLIVNVTGGTYAYNPEEVKFIMHEYEGEDVEKLAKNIDSVRIPATHEVKTIETQQGGLQTTLYRVRKIITTSESINDNVEGQGAGVNANTEFLISGDETVAADATVAHYVEVSNDATLTLPAGKELTVKNGLDVTDGAVLDVQAGSTLIVGEGGVTAESVESIVIETDENGSASFLLDPEVIVNTTPNITIKMTAKGVGYEMDEEEQDYYWFRFAAPVAGIEAVDKNPVRATYFYKWDYAADQWNSISALSELEPFQGFSLTTNHEGLEDVTYTFKGRLAGNQDMKLQFQSRGYNYFGNSYTGYIDVLALVEQLMENDAIDGTVYMWDNANQRFKDVPLGDLTMADASWKREVAPMQTFILRQVKTGVPTSTEINYASAIWGNPRYGLVSAPAPARQRVNNDVAKLTIVVTSANGKIDEITFKESNEFSDEYNKGFDAVKFMNERQINLYSTIDGENLGTVATNNIEGKLISMQTVKALNYTMSFEDVNSDEYAIRDNVTGKVIVIEEGATYEFAAQPNSVIEGRFEIVSRANMPTAIENTEVKANVKGIYTIMGQYLGENFDILPAGVYVVNGVKIVK